MNPAIDRSEDLMGQSGWGIEKFGNGMGSNEAIGSVNSSAVAKSTGTLQKTAFDSGSYRDRTGRVVHHQNRIYRLLNDSGAEDWRHVRSTRFWEDAQQQGKVVRTTEVEGIGWEELESDQKWAMALEHERIPFISYPYEWSWSMLRDAALLHLDLLQEGLKESVLTKDGSAYNVQWRGVTPTFIDIGSLCRWNEGDAWVGYRQFCQTFLFPLMLTAHQGIPFQPWLRGTLDGIEVREISRAFGWWDFWKSGVLVDVWLHHQLQKRGDSNAGNRHVAAPGPRLSRSMIQNNLGRLKRSVERLAPRISGTHWAGYANRNSYSTDDQLKKQAFIREISERKHWGLVWDIGCNTGDFSRLVAPHADQVVAIDGDLSSVELLYQELRRTGVKNILPLCVNLADASPNQGWLGKERRELSDRGRPDLVLALALIHHLVIGANLRMTEVIDWFAELGGELAIEFVGRDDPMVKSLLRHKPDHYFDYDQVYFEELLRCHYRIERREDLISGTRTIYHCVSHEVDSGEVDSGEVDSGKNSRTAGSHVAS